MRFGFSFRLQRIEGLMLTLKLTLRTDIKYSGYRPILPFSIFLHFPMCSVDRNPFGYNMGVMGWLTVIRNEFAILT